eukprot:jgi/Bigna1/87744/estExt_fgenesh1_pg.C_230177
MSAKRRDDAPAQRKARGHRNAKNADMKLTVKNKDPRSKSNGAASPDGEGREVDLKAMESSRVSLLDVAKEIAQKRAHTRTTRVERLNLVQFAIALVQARLVYTATRGTNDGIEEFHGDWFKKNSKIHDVTGLATLISGTMFLHIVEAPTKILLGLLKDLIVAEEKKLTMKNVKIMAFTEEVSRIYRTWTCESVAMDPDDAGDVEILTLSWGICKDMLKMGIDAKAATPTKAMFQKYLPSTQKLVKVSSSNDLCTPSEYLKIFHSTVDFTMDSEKHWPAMDLVAF